MECKFYKLQRTPSSTRAAWSKDEYISSENYCPQYPEHSGEGRRISELSIIIPSLKFTDFIWTWYSELIITDKVLSILSNANVTGFEALPVKVSKIKRCGKDPYQLQPLWEVKVTGKGGHADPACGIIQKFKCEYCNLRTYTPYNDSIIIVPENWDGSDMFTINGFPRHIFVVERVKNLILENKLKGCEFKLSTEIKWNNSIVRSDITIFEFD